MPRPLPIRAILLENPAALEHLEPDEAARADRLLEASQLEPLLFAKTRELGVERLIGPERLGRWRLAGLMADARAQAYGEAWTEVRSAAERSSTAVALRAAPAAAFTLYASPALRPFAALDVEAAEDRAAALHEALRSRRFLPLVDAVTEARREPHALQPLERDGVVIRVHCGRAEPLTAEALVLSIAREMAARGFAHSLLSLHDLHLALTKLALDARALADLAAGEGAARETALALSLARDILGSPACASVLESREDRLSGPRRKLLLKLARSALLSYPVPPILAARTRELLAGIPARRRAAAAAV